MKNTSTMNSMLRSCALWLATLLVGVAQAATITYYHNDLAGSPVAATNASGTVIWRESYRPYGERLTNSAAASGNTVWFTSRRQDAETGLVYMGARYYDPVVGRFMSTDPVQFMDSNLHSFNRYAYANNNPYKYVDPDGNLPVLIPLVGMAVRALAQRAVTFALTRGAQTSVTAVEIGAGEALGGGTLVAAAAAERAVAKGIAVGSKTVLGHYPEYGTLADALAARRFNVPESAWNKMSDAERWAANQRFLDRTISRGDDIILATPLDQVRPGSYFAKELEYLGGKGFVPSADGTRLVKQAPND